MELFDLEDFYFNKVNMSGWRLVDMESDRVRETLQQMQKFHPLGSNIVSKNGSIEVYMLTSFYELIQNIVHENFNF